MAIKRTARGTVGRAVWKKKNNNVDVLAKFLIFFFRRPLSRKNDLC